MSEKEKLERLWSRIESVRNNPDAMRLLDRLIKIHTS